MRTVPLKATVFAQLLSINRVSISNFEQLDTSCVHKELSQRYTLCKFCSVELTNHYLVLKAIKGDTLNLKTCTKKLKYVFSKPFSTTFQQSGFSVVRSGMKVLMSKPALRI